MMSESNKFSAKVIEVLNYYVYRLIDPRNGITFYVGKGRGNRVFQHASGEQPHGDEDKVDLKIERIWQIKNSGLEVQHIIHRHGLDENIALEVECALIDAYPGLTNLISGAGSDRGVMHADEVIRLYDMPEAVIRHNVIFINVNLSLDELPLRPLSDAVRYAWRIDKVKAEGYDYVLATQRGRVIGAFVASNWRHATQDNFPGFPVLDEKRWGFDVKEASPEIKSQYLQQRVPARYRPQGAANPIRYAEPEKIMRIDQ